MRRFLTLAALLLLPAAWQGLARGDDQADRPWRALPLIQDGQVHPDWVQMGYGGFAVDRGTLRTECVEQGMGLLLYRKEKLGNCQIRVVYRSQEPKSNSGVFIRIDEGVLQKVNEKAPAVTRMPDGNLSEQMIEKLMDASERERGPWYPVHHGYEVQICDAADAGHRTGAVYSLANAAAVPGKPATDWRTLVITLKGNLVLVDLDGKRVTTFDPDSRNVPGERKWYEPKREPKRPQAGYIGLQNHDPGDVVYFKEVSVRALADGP